MSDLFEKLLIIRTPKIGPVRYAELIKRFGTVSCQKGMTIVCIIGDLSCQNIGMQSQIIESLKEIPTHMISYGGSPFNSSFLINTRDKEVALNSLNNQLF